MALPRIRLFLQAGGPSVIQVDGDDISDRVAEVQLKCEARGVPEVWLRQRGELDIEGEAIVRVIQERDADPAEVIVAFLDAIDVEQLYTDALEDVGMGEGNLTQEIVDTLKGYARAGS